MMSNSNLDRLLNSVGKRIFVDYYLDFKKLPNQEMIDRLPQQYTLKSRRSRTNHARRIFREGLEIEALSIVAKPSKMDAETVATANKYIEVHKTRKVQAANPTR